MKYKCINSMFDNTFSVVFLGGTIYDSYMKRFFYGEDDYRDFMCLKTEYGSDFIIKPSSVFDFHFKLIEDMPKFDNE